MSFKEVNKPETYLEYRERHYGKQYVDATRILTKLLGEKSDWTDQIFKCVLPVLLDKMWTPEVYLKKKFYRNNKPENKSLISMSNNICYGLDEDRKSKDIADPTLTSIDGELEKQIPDTKTTARLKQPDHVSVGDSSLLVLPDAYDKLVVAEGDTVRTTKYLHPDDWNNINNILKEYGFEWVSAGKESRWQKQ